MQMNFTINTLLFYNLELKLCFKGVSALSIFYTVAKYYILTFPFRRLLKTVIGWSCCIFHIIIQTEYSVFQLCMLSLIPKEFVCFCLFGLLII